MSFLKYLQEKADQHTLNEDVEKTIMELVKAKKFKTLLDMITGEDDSDLADDVRMEFEENDVYLYTQIMELLAKMFPK